MRVLRHKDRPYRFTIGRHTVVICEPLPTTGRKRFKWHNVPVEHIRRLARENAPNLSSAPIRPFHIQLWITCRIEKLSTNIVVDDGSDARLARSIDDWVIPPFRT